MNKKIGALFVAVGVIASACGGSSESRTRNAVIERDVACFATEQDKTDTENAMLQRKSEFEGRDQRQMMDQFALVQQRVSEVYNRQLAHPEWDTRLSGTLSDQGRKELEELSADYSAILEEYEALRQAIWMTDIEDGPAYFETKYQRAVATPVCEVANDAATDELNSDESTTSSVSDQVITNDPSESPATESSNETTETTNSAIGDINVAAGQMICPKPVLQSHGAVRTLVNKMNSFNVSKCKSYETEIYVQIVGGSATFDDIATSVSATKDEWGVMFAKPGTYEVNLRFMHRGIPVSRLSNGITFKVGDTAAVDPCAGTTPQIDLSEDYTQITAKSNCTQSDRIDIMIYGRAGTSVTELHYSMQFGDGETHDSLFGMMLPAGEYRLRAHQLVAIENEWGYSGGDPATVDFEWPITANQATAPDNPIVSIMPVGFFERADDPVDNSSPSDTPAAPTAFAVPETVEAMKCDDACMTGLAKQAEIPAGDVKTIEASVFDGTWFPLVANSDIPLTGSVTKLAVRVTPKSGESVVVATSIHKGSVSETEEAGTDNEATAVVYADSANPGSTFTVGASQEGSFLSTNWWWIVLLIVLALAVLAYGARKRAAQPGR